MRYVTLIIVVVVVVLTAADIKLPNYIAPCKAKDELCLKKTLKGLVARLNVGIPELNIPSIDPVSLPDYNQTDFSLQKMPYTALVKDVRYSGVNKFEIIKFDVDLDALTFNLVVFFPQLIMKAYETIWMKAFDIEVDGEGLATEYYNNITINFSLNGEKYSSNKRKYIKWTEDHISVSVDGISAFDVDPSFTDAHDYQQVLNKGSRDFAHVFNPELAIHIKNTIGLFIFRTINSVHEIIPVDVLYIPDK